MFQRHRIVLTIVSASCVWLGVAQWLTGCGEDTVTPTADAGLDVYTAPDTHYEEPADASDASVDARDAADADKPYEDVNDCLKEGYEDRTATSASRVITSPDAADPMPYAPPCMKISRNQSVQFIGSFGDHPLEPSTTPNPIPNTSSGTKVEVSFPNAGVFGYRCGIPYHQQMKGAVWVVP